MTNVVFRRFEYFEFILLTNKPHCYSQHNHISVYTIGLVLNGHVCLQTNNARAISQAQLCYHKAVWASRAYPARFIPHAHYLYRAEPSYDTHRISAISQTAAQLKFFGRIDFALPGNAIHALYRVIPCTKTRDDILCSAMRLRNSPECDMGIQEMADAAHTSKYHFLECLNAPWALRRIGFSCKTEYEKRSGLLKTACP